jgi:hypothetical protein
MRVIVEITTGAGLMQFVELEPDEVVGGQDRHAFPQPQTNLESDQSEADTGKGKTGAGRQSSDDVPNIVLFHGDFGQRYCTFEPVAFT